MKYGVKSRLERIRVNGQTIAIRAVITKEAGATFSKQFVLNSNVTEADAIQMAREYVEVIRTKPVAIPSEKEVIKLAEKVVVDAKLRDIKNAVAREGAKKDVAFVLSRYATTRVFGYNNTSGEWTQ
jgi:hypothetical protein